MNIPDQWLGGKWIKRCRFFQRTQSSGKEKVYKLIDGIIKDIKA